VAPGAAAGGPSPAADPLSPVRAALGRGEAGSGARVGGGVLSGRGATGAGVAVPGARPRFSASETIRSTTARDSSSS